jgi:uncharacterized RDD family membrane protein YckC
MTGRRPGAVGTAGALLLMLPAVATNGSRSGAANPGRGRISQLAGTISNRVLEGFDPDIVVERLDLDVLLGRVDVDALLARVDLEALLARIDVNTLLARVDVDAVLARIDVNALLDRADVDGLLRRVDVDALLAGIDVDAVAARVDLERMLDRVDLPRLARRAGLPELIAESSGHVAGSALDLARRQLVGVDIGIGRLLHRLLGRDPDALPAGPASLVVGVTEGIQTPEPTRSRVSATKEVSGFYAGAVSRVLAFGGDVALATSSFAVGAATLLWFLSTLWGVVLDTGARAGPWWSIALGGWLLLYWSGSTALTGRTPAMLLAGLRVVARDGSPLRPRQALLRTACLPVSLLAFGAGAAWMVVDRERRGLHDLVAGSAVVYDWGGRAADMPTPVARWIAAHDDGR